MDTLYDLEVSKEDESVLRNNWKLISTCQFLNMFRNVMKMSKEPSYVVTPYDLEQSLLRPQHDPLCGEIMSRLLHKKSVKKATAGTDGPPAQILATDLNYQSLDYETWNFLLAKRFSSMFKYYRKFSIRYFNKDPLVSVQTETLEALNALPLSLIMGEIKNSEGQGKPEESLEGQQNGAKDHTKQTGAESSEQQLVQLQQQLAQTQQEQSQEETKEQGLPVLRERVTRSRAAASTQQIGNTAQNKQQSKKAEKPKKEELDLKSQQEIDLPIPIEQLWSSDIREHLIRQHHEQNLTVRFQHEDLVGLGGQQSMKVEQLQTIKLFCEDLDTLDPFYIQGHDWVSNQKDEGANNFLFGLESVEDIDEGNTYGAGIFGQRQEVLFKKFHEISCKHRLDILFFLCQSKLDSEQPEFMQEVQALQQIKNAKPDDGSQSLKNGDDQKQILEAIDFCLLKELGQIKHSINDNSNDLLALQPGIYYYFPFFSDTRIYLQSFDNQDFKLIYESYEEALMFMTLLKEFEGVEECQAILEKIQSYDDLLKKYSDEMKWKEASKVRKLKSQIRSRKLQEHSRKKLQFEGRQSQLQTDYLHHAQGKVMTRKQIDTLKSKITKTSAATDEQKRRDKKGATFDPMAVKLQVIQKEKQDKDKQERQRRLEKRMRVKERIATGRLGKRRKRGDGSEEQESEQDYDQEDDQLEESNLQQKTQQANGGGALEEQKQEVPKAPEVYEIVLSGSLQSMFQRDPNSGQVVNETMVLRGSWKLTCEESGEEFIYKKIGPPLQEEELTKLFCANPSDKVTHQFIEGLNPAHQEMLSMFFSSPGLYDGYFKYNGESIKEKFSFILRKTSSRSRKQYFFELCGYGENQIGFFTMIGSLQLLPFEKLIEKDTAKSFRKVKLGKITMVRNYEKKILEEMVEDKLNERRNSNRDVHMDKTKTYFKISNIRGNMGSNQQPQTELREHQHQNIFAVHRQKPFETQVQKYPQMCQPTQQMIDLANHQDMINKLLQQTCQVDNSQMLYNMNGMQNPFPYGGIPQLDPSLQQVLQTQSLLDQNFKLPSQDLLPLLQQPIGQMNGLPFNQLAGIIQQMSKGNGNSQLNMQPLRSDQYNNLNLGGYFSSLGQNGGGN